MLASAFSLISETFTLVFPSFCLWWEVLTSWYVMGTFYNLLVWWQNMNKFQFVTRLASLTDHIPVAMTFTARVWGKTKFKDVLEVIIMFIISFILSPVSHLAMWTATVPLLFWVWLICVVGFFFIVCFLFWLLYTAANSFNDSVMYLLINNMLIYDFWGMITVHIWNATDLISSI